MNADRTSTNGRFRLRASVLAAGAIVAACSSSSTTDVSHADVSQASSSPTANVNASPASDPRVAWRKAMAKTDTPHDGCFTVTHPSTTWVEVPCVKAPSLPLLPAGRGARSARAVGGAPTTVGNTIDYSSTVTGSISWAEGSFPVVTGVTSESGVDGSNSYSLQLNTNTFSTSLCNGAVTPASCSGWQQFVYNASAGIGTIQYWLLNYENACPSGWTSTSLSPGNCYENAPNSVSAPSEPITEIGSMTLTATAGASDTTTLSLGETQLYKVSQPSILGLSAGAWKTAEFNVFGDDDAHVANFNAGATVVVKTLTDSTVATTNAPSCSPDTFTGETNNLSLLNNCCLAFGGGSPGVTFTESNVAGQACTVCGAEGQACCSTGTGWCASASDACSNGTCQPCGGSGEPCCTGNKCNSGDACQESICGAPNTLIASPSSLSVEIGDGNEGGNFVTTDLVAGGYWASNENVSPTLSFVTISVPSGVTMPASGKMPAGITEVISNDINPPTVKFTTADGTAAGTYKFAVTGTIGNYSVTTDVTLIAGACVPVTCASVDYKCGSFDNGCGGTSSCGTCPSGDTCTAGVCHTTCVTRTCPSPEFFNPLTCTCESCKCGTIDNQGKLLCRVCEP